MATLSLCMIVRDEEDVLDRCLSCVKEIADEIIIVDTGSKDRTLEIAAAYTKHVYSFPWVDDFAAARNYAFSKATRDYQMWLDADDVIDAENAKRLADLKANLDADVVMMPYQVAFDDADNPVFTYYRERILRRRCNFHWEGAVHEVIVPAGRIIYRDIAVQHRKLKVNDPARNLKIFRRLLQEGTSLDARQKFYYARELYYHQLYEDALQVYEGFLDAGDGWTENCITACHQAAACCSVLGRKEAALCYLFRSFLYDAPRAEICCEIGRILLESGKPRDAIFWYEAALKTELTDENGGFCMADCHDYVPYMQLCVCYDRIGNLRLAKAYNDKAGRIKPRDKNYLQNKQYFQERLKTGQSDYRR